MTGQILALEEFVAGLHEPSLNVKVDSPSAAGGLPTWDVDLLPVDRGGATPPTPSTSNCEVATQPSTLPLKRPYDEDHCSLAPLEDFDDNLDLDDSKDPSEAKRQKRMQRNRESAAISRKRKSAYIEQLESRLSELSQIAATLRTENDALRSGRRPLTGSAPVPVPTALMPALAELEEPLLLMPCLQSSDNDSESNDGTDTLEFYSSLEVFNLFSQEPLSSLTLPAASPV